MLPVIPVIPAGALPPVMLPIRQVPLVEAVKNNDINRVTQLLDDGADIEQHNPGRPSPLIQAVISDNQEMVNLLLDRGANINNSVLIRGGNIYPLLVAVMKNNLPMAKLLLQRGADPNYGDKKAISMAAAENKFEMVDLLLEAGADINISDIENSKPLEYAMNKIGAGSSIEMVQYLIDSGTSPFVRDVCTTARCSELLAKYQWEQIVQNVDKLSKQYSRTGDLQLPSDLWKLILLRKRQKSLCSSLSRPDHLYLLQLFANYLDIPISDETTKSELCGLISRQLVWGGKYSEESAKYFTVRENRQKIFKVAQQLGVDISQPLRNILDDIELKLRI